MDFRVFPNSNKVFLFISTVFHQIFQFLRCWTIIDVETSLYSVHCISLSMHFDWFIFSSKSLTNSIHPNFMLWFFQICFIFQFLQIVFPIYDPFQLCFEVLFLVYIPQSRPLIVVSVLYCDC